LKSSGAVGGVEFPPLGAVALTSTAASPEAAEPLEFDESDPLEKNVSCQSLAIVVLSTTSLSITAFIASNLVFASVKSNLLAS